MKEIAGLPQWVFINSVGGSLVVLLLLFSSTFTDLLSYLFIKLVTVLAVWHLADYVYRHRHLLVRSVGPHSKGIVLPLQVQQFLRWTRKMDGTELRGPSQVDLGWPVPKGCSPDATPTVLITGAAFGLGKEMAHRYAEMGYKLVLWDIQAEALQATASELKAKYSGSNADSLSVQTDIVDVGDAESVQQKCTDLGYRGVDILILNAGIVSGKRAVDTTAASVERVFKVNVFQHFNMCRALVPLMKEEGVERRIVIVGSVAGFAGTASMSDYNGSKAAANTFAEALSAELRETNISVSLVCPNVINTGMFPGFKPLPLLPMLDTKEVVQEIIDAVRYRKRWIVLPWRILVIPMTKYISPWSLIPWIDWTLGASRAMDNFGGSENAVKDKKE